MSNDTGPSAVIPKGRADLNVKTHEGYWLDIGRPDDYFRAVEEWPELREKLGL